MASNPFLLGLASTRELFIYCCYVLAYDLCRKKDGQTIMKDQLFVWALRFSKWYYCKALSLLRRLVRRVRNNNNMGEKT